MILLSLARSSFEEMFLVVCDKQIKIIFEDMPSHTDDDTNIIAPIRVSLDMNVIDFVVWNNTSEKVRIAKSLIKKNEAITVS